LLPASEQLQVIRKNCVDLFSEEELLERLKTGKPMRVKLGVDPSRPDLHLGHAVVLRKLRQFQELGHKVVLIIGDFTARIGDPSGKSSTRPMLGMEEVREYAQTYQEQAYRILDRQMTEVRFNGEWLDKMHFEDVIRLAARYTVARMLERDDFHNRYVAGQPISVAEFLYPLAQAYDSVAVEADVEMGGTDQLFNLLVGRKIQEEHGQRPQVVLTMPIIEGTDGHLKMSKSLGNYIAFNDTPEDMYGKIMSIPDDLMIKYYRLLTDLAEDQVAALAHSAQDGTSNPRDFKMKLAFQMVEWLFDATQAAWAQEHFVSVFQKKNVPDQMPELPLPSRTISPVDLLVAAGVKSKSEAKRLCQQGGVSIDERKIEDPFSSLDISSGAVLRIGKRRFFRLVAN